MAYKRWLVTLFAEHEEWLKQMIEETKLTGTEIIRELIDQARAKDQAKLKAAIQKAHFERRIKKLQDQMKGEKTSDETGMSEAGEPVRI